MRADAVAAYFDLGVDQFSSIVDTAEGALRLVIPRDVRATEIALTSETCDSKGLKLKSGATPARQVPSASATCNCRGCQDDPLRLGAYRRRTVDRSSALLSDSFLPCFSRQTVGFING